MTGSASGINRAAERLPGGQGDMKTRPRVGSAGPEKKAETNQAIDSAAMTGNVLGAACRHLKEMHPQGYDDKGPHRDDAWMKRSKK